MKALATSDMHLEWRGLHDIPPLNESFDLTRAAGICEGHPKKAVQSPEVVMASVVRDWRVELVEAHSDLFQSARDPHTAQGFPEVGDGWRDLLERACIRIRAAVRAHGGTFCATQIKEKYGTLRFYWDGAMSPAATTKVEEAIDLAEARSACTCEICGEMGRLYGLSWLTTRCEAHADGRSPVEFRPGFENLQIEERFVGDRRETRCRRYDRDTDSFINVDLATLGIEEP